jgi:CHASE2 domain-containing sensor protein
LSKLRISLAAGNILISLYMLITQSFDWIPFSSFLLGMLMLVIGWEELKKGKRGFFFNTLQTLLA